MTKLLKTLITVAVVSVLAFSVASAGQNAGATAYIYWLSAATTTGTVIGSRDITSCTAVCQVTIKGLSNFRGADVQLVINSLTASGLPPAWQATGVGGPADGNYSVKWYSYNTTLFPDAFLTTTAGGVVTGIVKTQDASAVNYQNTASACLTPHNVGLIWLSAAGAAGKGRVSTVEYGVLGWKMLLCTGCCVGDIPNGPIGVCIAPNFRQPCSAGEQGLKMQTVDATATKDMVPFSSPNFCWLTWFGIQHPGSPNNPCWLVTPAANTTWGQIKRLYH